MTSKPALDKKMSLNNPIDTVEDFVASQEWPCQRVSYDELLVDVPGRWCDYQVSFFWQEDLNVLQLFTCLDLKIDAKREVEATRLLGLVNQRLAFGHFEVAEEGTVPAYRYAYLLTGIGVLKSALLEELMEFSLNECERFYPAFQFALLGNKTADEAVAIALLDTLGEA
jgi:hypothetical protein